MYINQGTVPSLQNGKLIATQTIESGAIFSKHVKFYRICLKSLIVRAIVEEILARIGRLSISRQLSSKRTSQEIDMEKNKLMRKLMQSLTCFKRIYGNITLVTMMQTVYSLILMSKERVERKPNFYSLLLRNPKRPEI